MRRIRGGSGLGDALYVRAVADYLIAGGETVEACSDYKDVFLNSGATVSPFRRDRIDMLCHYSARKSRTDTTQWEDVCGTAGIEVIPFRINWTVQNQALVDDLRAKAEGRPVVLVHGGRAPMGRTDGFGAELLPERRTFDSVLDALRDCFLVRVGNGVQTYRLHVNLDLTGKTSVAELIDIGSACDGVVAQCSYAVPLAEAFDKPLLAVWAERGMRAAHAYIKTITPQKIFSKPTSSHVVDDWSDERIKEAVRAVHEMMRKTNAGHH